MSVFENIDLNEIDPNVKPVPEGPYSLQVMSITPKEFTYKRGEKIGQTGGKINFKFVITNHADLAGRTIYDDLWADDFGFRMCRRLADASGVRQTGDFEAWTKEIAVVKPVVKYPVLVKKDKNQDGVEIDKNKVRWQDVQPAAQ